MTMPPDDGTAVWEWMSHQAFQENGKIDGALLIEESKKRGYCVCPRSIRRMVDFSGMTCGWCEQPESKDSWRFWHEVVRPV